ncbi:MAG: hypothetical protein AAGL89_14525 [Pseudomonadota bacterium]
MIDDPTYVSEYEHGVVRVFLADSQLAMDIGHTGTYDRLFTALGVDQLDAAQIQQVQTRILKTDMVDAMSLREFLREGYDVRDEDLAKYGPALDAAEADDNLILILRTGAFLSRPVTLTTDGEAKLIATLREQNATVSFKPLPNPDPDAVVEDPPQKKRPSDAAMSGRIATLALLVMGLLVWLMIWIAG